MCESLKHILLTAYPNIVRVVVPSGDGVLVEFDAVDAQYIDPGSIAEQFAKDQKTSPSVSSSAPVLEIFTCYETPFAMDLHHVAESTGLTEEEIILTHTGRVYTVTSIGFIPGFGYLSSLDSTLRLPRRSSPRTRVPSGSVGIAEGLTGVYPVESPGGWHIIGRSPMTLFDPHLTPPSPLRVGQRVKFTRIDPDEFRQIEENNSTGFES